MRLSCFLTAIEQLQIPGLHNSQRWPLPDKSFHSHTQTFGCGIGRLPGTCSVDHLTTYKDTHGSSHRSVGNFGQSWNVSAKSVWASAVSTLFLFSRIPAKSATAPALARLLSAAVSRWRIYHTNKNTWISTTEIAQCNILFVFGQLVCFLPLC